MDMIHDLVRFYANIPRAFYKNQGMGSGYWRVPMKMGFPSHSTNGNVDCQLENTTTQHGFLTSHFVLILFLGESLVDLWNAGNTVHKGWVRPFMCA